MNLEDIKSQDDLDQLIANAVAEGKKGLEAKVNELLTEKKTEAARRKEAEEASKAKELEIAKAAGKVEEVEKALAEQYESKFAKLTEQNEMLNGEILSGKKEAVISSLASKFSDPDTGRMVLANMVETVRGEDGIVTNFKGLDGAVVTTEASKFAEHLASQDSFKSLLKGVDSSGGGAKGSNNSSGGAGGDTVQGRLAQRLKEKGLTS